jgi:hypothetical protein
LGVIVGIGVDFGIPLVSVGNDVDVDLVSFSVGIGVEVGVFFGLDFVCVGDVVIVAVADI